MLSYHLRLTSTAAEKHRLEGSWMSAFRYSNGTRGPITNEVALAVFLRVGLRKSVWAIQSM